jgi:hypothetical protein
VRQTPALVVYHAPGAVSVGLVKPGDFILTHGSSWVNRGIRFGQRIRFRGRDRSYAFWNHVAVVETSGGGIIEARGRGVRRALLDDYRHCPYAVLDVGASEADREEMLAFLRHCVGDPYGFVQIATLITWLATGGKLTVGMDGTEICSQLAARVAERAGAIFDRDPATVMPADFARHYDVKAPELRTI